MGHPCLRIKLRLHWWHSMRVNFPYPKTFSFLTFFPTRTWWHFERFTHLTQKNINTGPIMKPEWIGDPYFLPSSFPSYKAQSPLRKWWSVWWVPIYLQTGRELCGPHILSTERNTIRPTRWNGPHRHLRPWLILSGLQRTYFVFTPLSFDWLCSSVTPVFNNTKVNKHSKTGTGMEVAVRGQQCWHTWQDRWEFPRDKSVHLVGTRFTVTLISEV